MGHVSQGSAQIFGMWGVKHGGEREGARDYAGGGEERESARAREGETDYGRGERERERDREIIWNDAPRESLVADCASGGGGRVGCGVLLLCVVYLTLWCVV